MKNRTHEIGNRTRFENSRISAGIVISPSSRLTPFPQHGRPSSCGSRYCSRGSRRPPRTPSTGTSPTGPVWTPDRCPPGTTSRNSACLYTGACTRFRRSAPNGSGSTGRVKQRFASRAIRPVFDGY